MGLIRILPKITNTCVQTCSLDSIRKISDKDGTENLGLENRLYNVTRKITSNILYETISKPIASVDRFVIRLKNSISILNIFCIGTTLLIYKIFSRKQVNFN